jgi:hypothetical protein
MDELMQDKKHAKMAKIDMIIISILIVERCDSGMTIIGLEGQKTQRPTVEISIPVIPNPNISLFQKSVLKDLCRILSEMTANRYSLTCPSSNKPQITKKNKKSRTVKLFLFMN